MGKVRRHHWSEWVVEVPVNEEGKECAECGRLLSYDSYHRRKKSADGLQSVCRFCTYVRQQRTRLSNLAKSSNISKTNLRRSPTKGLRRNSAASRERLDHWLAGGDYDGSAPPEDRLSGRRLKAWLNGESGVYPEED